MERKQCCTGYHNKEIDLISLTPKPNIIAFVWYRLRSATMGIRSVSVYDVGHIYSWAEVSVVHKIRSGIYQRNGELISLLTDFGRINPCYPDLHGNTLDTILYTGNGRRGDQKLDAQNRALLDAIASEVSVPLFNKQAPGKWEFMGYWRVSGGKYVFDEFQSRSVWQFVLVRDS